MIRVRLFGGFEVWHADRQLRGFESQKVRALFAYLACQPGRPFSRDRLAGLFWPEQGADGARHALRQALYNLRSALPGRDSETPPLLVSHGDIRINPEAGLWLDIQAFEEALRRGTGRDGTDPYHLAIAVQLYRGDFLAGFFVRDCSEFEEWLVAEQERLREVAVEALRSLIESYRRRGEYRFGIHYARRLVVLEPLAEEARRDLMRLYAQTGRRNQALSEYEDLVSLLDRELGVEPLAESRGLYEAIRDEVPTQGVALADGEPIGPIIPLAGRRGAWEQLRESWRRVVAGEVQVTLVTGETGAGKTRLLRTFLDAVSGSRRTVVLRGAGRASSLPMPFLPWTELLRSAIDEAAEGAGPEPIALPPDRFLDLVRLVPDLAERRLELGAPPPLKRVADRRRMFETVSDFLSGLCSTAGGLASVPLVLFVDDLHLADGDSFDLLEIVLARMRGRPCWVLASACLDELPARHPLARLAGRAARIEVGRLESAAIEEISVSLVGDDRAVELARWLDQKSGGLPFAIAELINLLWDEGILVASDSGNWNLAASLGGATAPAASGDLDELLRERVRRLPSSVRRLAIQAAYMGPSFEAGLLQNAADEHPAVVEIGLELLLKRWLIRQSMRHWSSYGRTPDVVLWERGARRGTFEFAHQRVRQAFASAVGPDRQRSLDARAGLALERALGDRRERFVEELAIHYTQAELWQQALPYVEQAAARSRALLAHEAAARYAEIAAEVRAHLTASEPSS